MLISKKLCAKCRTVKDKCEFNKYYRSKDGLNSFCNSCKNICTKSHKRTKKGLITKIYSNQRRHSKDRSHPMPTYTKQELSSWLYSQSLFHILYDNWKRLDYQKDYVPSVDRKDDYIGYTMDNIQLMTFKENVLKSHNDKINGKNRKPLRAVIQYDKSGNFIKEYYSIIEAERKTGVYNQNITDCCMRRRKSAGGFIWRHK